MKEGLGQSYDRVEYLPVKMRAWLDLTQPASSLGIGFGFLIASLFFFFFTDQVGRLFEEWRIIIAGMFASLFIHGASQAMNMAEDAEIDKQTEHKKNRPIPSGIVSEEEARTLAWFLILGGLMISYIIRPIFGVFMTISAIFGIFYNLDPIRAKERIIGIPWQAMSRGLITFPIVWSAYGDPFTPVPWAFGVFMFFYVFGFQNTADIIDKKIDAEYGIRTFVVEFGVDGVIKIAFGSTLLMFAVILLAIEFSILPYRFIWMFSLLPFCLLIIHYMRSRPKAVSDRTGNHPAYLLYYFGMVLSVSVPLLTEIIG